MSSYPKDVGITAMEVYIPYLCVDQSELEKFDGVSQGKYTIGLGQKKMAFCGDQEDINSLCLTVVHNLIEKHKIDVKDIGRLEVGTETIIDKSKSVKTVLMQLFEPAGCTDIEGIDTTNACFGGTSAVFNAINWIESSSWDGRLAIVVVADIALYATGNARPTGGCGAIALLIGPNAPLVFDRGVRAFHMVHVYDFYKPNMSSEYAMIDGQLSIKCFLSSLDKCYERYRSKTMKQDTSSQNVSLKDIDYMIFHTPFCKMTKKAIGRLYLSDYLNSQDDADKTISPLEKYKNITLESTFNDPALFKDVERLSVECSSKEYNEKTKPSILLPTNTGNMYTASLYSSLVGLLINVPPNDLVGKRVGMYSYGSGLASCMFSLRVCPDSASQEDLNILIDSLKGVKDMLSMRKEVEPAKFVEIIETREKISKSEEFVPTCSPDDVYTGAYYLTKIDSKLRRFYERKC